MTLAKNERSDVMRLKLQKQSELKFVSRIIPYGDSKRKWNIQELSDVG